MVKQVWVKIHPLMIQVFQRITFYIIDLIKYRPKYQITGLPQNHKQKEKTNKQTYIWDNNCVSRHHGHC